MLGFGQTVHVVVAADLMLDSLVVDHCSGATWSATMARGTGLHVLSNSSRASMTSRANISISMAPIPWHCVEEFNNSGVHARSCLAIRLQFQCTRGITGCIACNLTDGVPIGFRYSNAPEEVAVHKSIDGVLKLHNIYGMRTQHTIGSE